MLTASADQPAASANGPGSYLELNTRPSDTVMLTVVELEGEQQRELRVELGAQPRVKIGSGQDGSYTSAQIIQQ